MRVTNELGRAVRIKGEPTQNERRPQSLATGFSYLKGELVFDGIDFHWALLAKIIL